MAEDLIVLNSAGNEVLEVSICQPDHPNQALFLQTLDISLKDFRNNIAGNNLVLPEEWLFMSRAGSLISTDQEENIQLNSITKHREDANVSDILIAPVSYLNSPPRQGPAPPKRALESIADIIGALRDVYVTSIQPNLHEFIKPMLLAAGLAAIAAFLLSGLLVVCFGVLDGISLTLLKPMLKHHLCDPEADVAAYNIRELNSRIHELESKMADMRKVEIGTFFCKDDHHMYEETETTTLYVPFRKTSFHDAPRVTFGLKSLSVDDPNSVRLEDLRVNSTGFLIRCSYFGKWMHYNLEYSWVAVGK